MYPLRKFLRGHMFQEAWWPCTEVLSFCSYSGGQFPPRPQRRAQTPGLGCLLQWGTLWKRGHTLALCKVGSEERVFLMSSSSRKWKQEGFGFGIQSWWESCKILRFIWCPHMGMLWSPWPFLLSDFRALQIKRLVLVLRFARKRVIPLPIPHTLGRMKAHPFPATWSCGVWLQGANHGGSRGWEKQKACREG